MSQFDVGEIVTALRAVRSEWRDSQNRPREPVSRELPSRDQLAQTIEQLKGALFPMRLGPPDLRHESEVRFYRRMLRGDLGYRLVLRHQGRPLFDLLDLEGVGSSQRFVNPEIALFERVAR